MVGECCTNVRGKNTFTVLVGRPEEKRAFGRPKLKWEDNIKLDFRQVEWKGAAFVWLRRDRWRALVNVVMNLRVH
jgi:hypothetical protein